MESRDQGQVDARPDENERPIDAAALTRSATAGAVAGIVATLAMSVVMLPAQWLGLLGTEPPRRISDRIFNATGSGARAPEAHRRVGTALIHLGIGSVGGALFGIGRLLSRRRGRAPIVGLGFGSALWGVNYIVAAPMLKLFQPPWDDRPGRPPVMLAANALYGVITAVLVERHGSRPDR